MYQGKSLLVTGSAGFIGSNYVHYMLKNTDISGIISIDKLSYASSISNLEGLDKTRHQLIIADISDASLIGKTLREFNIDTIIHFAAETHVDRSIISPKVFIDTNIVGTFVLLEEARQFWLNERGWNENQCRFHHISTDEVYGSLTSNALAFTEIHPYQPNSPYSASKASSDHLVRAYYHTYNLPITISNCSNNYGPHQHQEKFIPTVIRSCLKNQKIPIYGSGLNVRDWLYVEDHVRAIDCIVKYAKPGSTYNIGGKTEKTNLEVVLSICDWMDEHYPQTKSYSELINYVSDRLGHDWRYAINIDKIQKEFGWSPKINFQQGLTLTLNYYVKQYLNSKNSVEST